jgi:uncharacterized coiled-coil DUF342 family protein
MKTLINEKKTIIRRNSGIGNSTHLFPIMIFMLLSVVLSGSVSYPQKNNVQNEDSKSKSINILEKLENGKSVTKDEIAALFSSYKNKVSEADNMVPESGDILGLINIPDLPDLPDLPEITSLSDDINIHSSFDHHHKGSTGVIVISDSDLKEIHKKLAESVEELKKNIESLRNSEDFYRIQEELEKWSDNFKKDLKKMREDIVRSDKE